MTIHQTYNTRSITDVPDNSARPENWQLLITSYADFHECNHYSHNSTRIIVFSAGGGSGDILDESNGRALAELAEFWENQDMEGEDASSTYNNVRAEWPIISHHGMYDYTAVCVDPEEITRETLSNIVARRIEFDDYPVLDEADYSEREFTAFVRQFDDASSSISDDELDAHHPLYIAATEYAMENYYGYSEPGYISEEHVRDCWLNAGHAFTEED